MPHPSESPAWEHFVRLREMIAGTYPVETFHSRKRRFVARRRAVVVALREVGHSYPTIGLAMGLNHTTVMRLHRAATPSEVATAASLIDGSFERQPERHKGAIDPLPVDARFAYHTLALLTDAKRAADKNAIWNAAAAVLEARA